MKGKMRTIYTHGLKINEDRRVQRLKYENTGLNSK